MFFNFNSRLAAGKMKGGGSMEVRVSGWSTPRTILEKDGKVLFEVAEADGCFTCLGRIVHIKETLAAKNLAAEFRTMPSYYSERCLYVVLDAAPQGVDVKRYVEQTLGLRIS